MRSVSDKDHRIQTQKRRQLEAELGSPKKFWRSIKQLNVSQTKKKCNLMEVLDPEGNIRCNEEVMDVWCNHFSRLLGCVDESSCGEGGNGVEESTHGKQDSLDFSDRLCTPISAEEVQWALERVRSDATPGQDGIAVEMMKADCLLGVRVVLFQVCWEYGLVPSAWKESLVVPVPKKQAKGACDVNKFRGVSLTSTVSKVLCMQGWLSNFPVGEASMIIALARRVARWHGHACIAV